MLMFGQPTGQSNNDSSIQYVTRDNVPPYTLKVTLTYSSDSEQTFSFDFMVTEARRFPGYVASDRLGDDIVVSFQVVLLGTITPGTVTYGGGTLRDGAESLSGAGLSVAPAEGRPSWIVTIDVPKPDSMEPAPFEVWSMVEEDVDSTAVLLVGAAQFTQSVTLLCRYDARLVPGMSAELDGITYDVVRVAEIERRRYMRLSCQSQVAAVRSPVS